MDIHLPKISGTEAIRRLRAEPATAHTPIVAITSFALSGDEQKAKDAVATAYVAKPYSPFDLLTICSSSFESCYPKYEREAEVERRRSEATQAST